MPIDSTQDGDVQKFAAEYGEVESIRTFKQRRLRDGSMSRPVFSVRYSSPEAANAAVAGLAGKSVGEGSLGFEFKIIRRRRRSDEAAPAPRRPRVQRIIDPVKVFVRASDTTEDKVRNFLKDCGAIDAIEVAASGVSFTITFANAESTKKALELHGNSIGESVVQVRPFRTFVREAEPETPAEPAKEAAPAKQKKKQRRPRTRVFVAGFPVDTDPETMLDTFEGSIKATVRNQTAFVTFESGDFAQKCIDDFSGKVALGADQELRVEYARVPRGRRIPRGPKKGGE
jgi:hypothetical protein